MKSRPSYIELLARYQPVSLSPTPQSAAVMLILLDQGTDSFEIVLTERAAHLERYAGDFSFPGGMQDEGDTDLYATVTREVEEELNLPAHAYQLIGQLDDFTDRYGHLVRPFVVLMKKTEFEKLHRIAASEIASIYYFSLSKLPAIKDTPALHTITRRRPSYAFTEGQVFVWGLTATILVHLSNILSGESKPLGNPNP
ncbi:putative Nudix hydrolase NudL [Aquicella siphonis]|uniref:Putative Nudix hydrolase NudL n=1 Tax=Aquicella siphonis TaxID=254247 RepID=A0A5E4PJQ6_9COXI|nr:CoA pyrophosphatase [Aquicella siphonis]VVC77280.1 putative Nudix hydrolase NudL [Aquicella siphonis]